MVEIKTLKGTRDYLPEQQLLKEKVISIIKDVFKRYGYMPVETSILDFYDIAIKKCGPEIIQEIYRLKDRANRDLCLRYELTFKLAKLMAKQIALPFKRYEIGKVFRDGPVTTARLREFTQCDVDCVGIKDVAVDAELMALTFDVFEELGLDVTIQINNRKFLDGLLRMCGIKNDKIEHAFIALDKLAKIGKKGVVNEMKRFGIDENSIKKIFSYFDKIQKKDNQQKIEFFKNLDDENIRQGLKEIEEFFYWCNVFLQNRKKFDDIVFVPSLVRGLAYYTGMVYEVYLKNSNIKRSVAAGGRWDNLISDFLQVKQQYPATGMSFGLDVICEALKEKKEKIFDIKLPTLIIPITEKERIEAIKLAQQLREKKIYVDISYKPLTKSLDYANKKGIKYCLIIGKKEIEEKRYKLKDMESGKEYLLSKKEIIKKLKGK